MKKLIAILVVFAIVAGAAFAQEGSWWVGGAGEIGAIVNFIPLSPADKDNDGSPDGTGPVVGFFNYNRYDWWGDIAAINVGYNNGGLSLGFGFNVADGIGLNASYDGGTWGFQVDQNLADFISKTTNPGRMWGWMKFLDDKIYLEVATRAKDAGFWLTNEAVGNVFDKWGFTNLNENDGITLDFGLVEGLTFGVQFPSTFSHAGYTRRGGMNYSQVPGLPGSLEWEANRYKQLREEVSDKMAFGAKFATGALAASLHGKFNPEGPRGTFGTFAGVNYQINDQMNAGLNFRGVFGNKDDSYSMRLKDAVYSNHVNNLFSDPENPTDAEKKAYEDEVGKNPLLKSYSDIAVALSFGMNMGDLGLGVEAGIAFIPGSTYSGADHKGQIGIKPKVSYNIISTHLAASLGLGFYIDSGYYREYKIEGASDPVKQGTGRYKLDNDGNVTKDWEQFGAQVGWDMTLELFFNPLGTGASAGYSWGGPQVIGRYKLSGGQLRKNGNGWTNNPAPGVWGGHTSNPTYSAFDIAFCWKF